MLACRDQEKNAPRPYNQCISECNCSKLKWIAQCGNSFQNDKPVLQDRINCFAMDVIEKVRDYNLKKQAERVLQAKLKGSKQKKPRHKAAVRASESSQISPPPSQKNINWSPQ